MMQPPRRLALARVLIYCALLTALPLTSSTSTATGSNSGSASTATDSSVGDSSDNVLGVPTTSSAATGDVSHVPSPSPSASSSPAPIAAYSPSPSPEPTPSPALASAAGSSAGSAPSPDTSTSHQAVTDPAPEPSTSPSPSKSPTPTPTPVPSISVTPSPAPAVSETPAPEHTAPAVSVPSAPHEPTTPATSPHASPLPSTSGSASGTETPSPTTAAPKETPKETPVPETTSPPITEVPATPVPVSSPVATSSPKPNTPAPAATSQPSTPAPQDSSIPPEAPSAPVSTPVATTSAPVIVVPVVRPPRPNTPPAEPPSALVSTPIATTSTPVPVAPVAPLPNPQPIEAPSEPVSPPVSTSSAPVPVVPVAPLPRPDTPTEAPSVSASPPVATDSTSVTPTPEPNTPASAVALPPPTPRSSDPPSVPPPADPPASTTSPVPVAAHADTDRSQSPTPAPAPVPVQPRPSAHHPAEPHHPDGPIPGPALTMPPQPVPARTPAASDAPEQVPGHALTMPPTATQRPHPSKSPAPAIDQPITVGSKASGSTDSSRSNVTHPSSPASAPRGNHTVRGHRVNVTDDVASEGSRRNETVGVAKECFNISTANASGEGSVRCVPLTNSDANVPVHSLGNTSIDNATEVFSESSPVIVQVQPLVRGEPSEVPKSPNPTPPPYRSTYCRCSSNQCQNEIPGDDLGAVCIDPSSDGSCKNGYKKCVPTDSYKLEIYPTTPNSMANAKFSLLGSDIAGAFYNLGSQNPLANDNKWWVAIVLPKGWHFVVWDKTQLQVKLTEKDIVRNYKLNSCAAVMPNALCPDASEQQVGFVDMMDLLSGNQLDWMNSTTKLPMSFQLQDSVISGACKSNGDGVSVVLAYEKTKAPKKKRTRELTVSATGSTSLSLGDSVGVVPLATMTVPSIEEGNLHSSLIWVEIEEDRRKLTLSFSTSTIIGPQSVKPMVCVNLRSQQCSNRGQVPTANISLDSASVVYIKDGNPFINYYSSPGDAALSIGKKNETFFCLENLLPTGSDVNKTWEMKPEFTFQFQLRGIAWKMEKEVPSSLPQVPLLAELTLVDQDTIQGSDCAQILVHQQTTINRGLSVYSVMSITIYAVGLVGAVLVTRMNGITFSGASFYNDMTSVCVVLIFLLSIIGNAIWIHVSSSTRDTAAGSHIYYLLRQITTCFTWTMMTSVCFHWSNVLHHDVRRNRQLFSLVAFLIVNGAFYSFNIFNFISLAEFYKCTYDEYLKNPLYSLKLCDTDYCPDLQPSQWYYATSQVCKDVSYSKWFFPAILGGEVLIFVSALVLLILGGCVLRRGANLIEQSGTYFDDRIVAVMKKSLLTYLGVILAISVSLGISCIIDLILYSKDARMNAVVWYVFTVWLPTVIPPTGFLILQWNPRLHGLHWDPAMHSKQSASKDNDAEHGTDSKVPLNDSELLSDGWAGISQFPDTNYATIGAEGPADGTHNVLALSLQLVSPLPISHACFAELYVADVGNDVTGEDSFDEQVGHRGRSSISSFIQAGIQQHGWMQRASQPVAMHASSSAQWIRIGFTETVLPVLVKGGESDTATQVAQFLSVLQLPVMPSNPVLRFVIYELPEATVSPTSDRTSTDEYSRARASSVQMDERAKNSRVSGLGLAPPTRPRVFCEFTCASNDMLASDEMNLVARQGSHRHFPSFSDGEGTSMFSSINAPRLRIRSMTVTTRTLKENTGFYITKCFNFMEEGQMVVEDMIESVFTNEIPRQFLEHLRKERSEDLAQAKADLKAFEERCKNGLMNGLYDNLIDQIQGENDQAVVRTWLEDRVRQRSMYVDALKDCLQVCVDRAEDGANFKASTEKKSMQLRFLPINLHVQDFYVGPAADVRSQQSRRTAYTVRAYPTITVGAFAAHSFKFRHGMGMLSLRNKMEKRSVSRLSEVALDANCSTDASHDWTQADMRSHDDIRWQLITRMDTCMSQALAALVTSFCRCLEHAMQHPVDNQFLTLIDSIGFLFQVESLLSTQGKENGMLEDFYAATDAMKNVSFVLDTSPPSHFPPTLNLHVKNTDLPSVVSVRLNSNGGKRAFTVFISVRCSPQVLEKIPEGIRNGGRIAVTPVMFTQGINEMQTLSNNAGVKKTSLQDIINQKSFARLTLYIDKYKKLAAKRPSAVPTDVETITTLASSLEERINVASKQMVKHKHPKIIQEGSRLCRLLGGGRVTSCKSAKDRTGMSVTLEQTQLLSDHHGLPQEFVVRTVSTMRSNGVRLENAFKNTGKRMYAFNALQRSLLPEEYRCPEGTYGRGNVS